MGSLLSRTEIYNLALNKLRSPPITSINDGKEVTNWLNREYVSARDSELRAHPWTFARARAALPADATAPGFGWTKSYSLPADYLSLLPLTIDGWPNSTRVDYELEGAKILTNCTAPLKVRYIRRVDVEGEFDPLFAEVLALRLAMGMSHWLTGKQSFTDRVTASYNAARAEARRVNGIENTFPRVNAEDVIAVRA